MFPRISEKHGVSQLAELCKNGPPKNKKQCGLLGVLLNQAIKFYNVLMFGKLV